MPLLLRRKLNPKSSQRPSKVADHVNTSNQFVALRIAGATTVAQRIAPPDAGNYTLLISNTIRLDMAALPPPKWLVSLAQTTQGVR